MAYRVQATGTSFATRCWIALLSITLAGCSQGDSATALMEQARAYQQKGDNKAALIQLKNAVVKSPENAELRIQLGNLYVEMYEGLNAEKEFRKALTLGARREQILLGLAKSLQMQSAYQKLLDETEASVGQHDPDVTLVRADALLNLQRVEDARDAYASVLKARPDGADALTGMARFAFSQKDVEGANRYAAQALAKYPADVEVLMFNGALLQVQGKSEQAMAMYDKVLALKSNHPSVWIEKAALDIAAKRYDAAKAAIEAGRKIDAANLQYLYMQALLEHSQGKNAAARDSLQKLLSAAPEHMPSILLAAVVESQLGNVEQSQRHARTYLQSNPQHAYARNLLITMLLRSGDTNEALASLALAMRDQPPSAALYSLAGQVYLQASDYRKASDSFEKASAMAPKDARIRTSLGLSRLGLGDNERGLSEMELATSIEADSRKAALALASIQLRLKQFDKAIATLSGIEKKSPNDAYVLNLKGAAYESKGDAEQARQAFEQALKASPNYLAAATNLAKIDIKQNKPAVAKARYEAFLAKNPHHPGVMAALADLAATQGNTQETLSWSQRAHTENPTLLAPAMRLAYLYLRTGKPVEALNLVRKFQVTNSTNTELLDLVGHIQIANKDATGAVETYSRLASILPKSPDVQFRLGTAQLLAKNDNAAMTHLKRAIALRPDFQEAQLAHLQLLVKRNEVEQAIVAAIQLQKQYPKDPTAHILEGSLLTAQKRPEHAVKAFERALAIDKSASTLIKLHAAMVQAGQEKQADERMAQWQKANPADVQTRMYLAEANIARRRFPAAIAELEALLKATPGNVVALNNLAWAYYQEKDPRAVETAEKAFKLAPGNANVTDTLGWILVERGDAARGVTLLEAASKIAPGALDIRYHLASALAKAGQKDRARRELELIVAQGKGSAMLLPAQTLLKQL